MIIVHSSAKINLTLDVLSRRSDGYHELQSVIHAIGLWDTLTFDFSSDKPDGLTLHCGDKRLESGDNLIFKALRAWLLAAKTHGFTEVTKMHVTLEKRIPMGAGLGGGSGNAAATLLALNRHFGDVMSENELHAVAAKIGADVPFFLRGGCALLEGIGEKLTLFPVLEGWLVVVQPPRALSTPEVFRAWDELNRESGGATSQLLRALARLSNFDLNSIAAKLGNDLSAAAQHLGLDVAQFKNLLIEHNALGAEMTGSGSAVFGLFNTENAARDAASRIEAQRERLGLSFVAAIRSVTKPCDFPALPKPCKITDRQGSLPGAFYVGQY